jgi:ATP-dependent Clp protease ATP-binding subunit ClpB
VYGARPLKRAIQQLIENPLAHALLAGDFSPGNEIEAELVNGTITFTAGTAVSETA